MKKITFILFCFFSLINTKAQIAKWLIPPSYEKIQLADGIDAVMTETSGVKTVWTMDGQQLFSCKDELYPFKEGIALSVKQGTSQTLAAYKQNGEKILIEGCNVAQNYPYYSNGKLLVKKGEYYRFVDTEGTVQEGKYTNAYPYFNGYATCETYSNFEKLKDPYHLLIDENGTLVNFYNQDKLIDNSDLQFVSSINDENIGIVVAKSKVFFFNGISKKLSPVFAKDAPNPNLKEQVKLISDIEDSFLQISDSTYVLIAKYGKNDTVSICFDTMKRPVYIKRNDAVQFYKSNSVSGKKHESDLTIKKKGDSFGLYWNNSEEMLPPQFDKIITCFADKALVELKGKSGMLRIIKDESFKLKMNKGDDIAFRHQKFETSIRADFPTFLNAEKVNIEVDSNSGCDVDKTSKNPKNTENGNFVEYNCVLNIPSNLPDELTTIKYPVTIYYDGLKSSKIPFDVNAWHYKYFVVDVDDSQTTLENGTVSFIFNINAERFINDREYPTAVNLITDSLKYEYEKMSEVRHKCKVYSLNEGINNIVIQVIEQGCPPASFPFEVEYHKPVAKSRNKPAQKEQVVIKKKEKAAKPANKVNDGPRVIM